jgi:hypothetical protein
VNLEKLRIGRGLQEIGALSFKGCSKLTEISYNGTKGAWEEKNGFYNWSETGLNKVICTDGEIEIL